jgi:hypothetical protein
MYRTTNMGTATASAIAFCNGRFSCARRSNQQHAIARLQSMRTQNVSAMLLFDELTKIAACGVREDQIFQPPAWHDLADEVPASAEGVDGGYRCAMHTVSISISVGRNGFYKSISQHIMALRAFFRNNRLGYRAKSALISGVSGVNK